MPTRSEFEIVALRDVAQVVVDERFLQAGEGLLTRVALARVGIDDADLVDRKVIDVEDRRHPELELGRLEGGVALGEGEARKQILVYEGLADAAVGVDLARVLG